MRHVHRLRSIVDRDDSRACHFDRRLKLFLDLLCGQFSKAACGNVLVSSFDPNDPPIGVPRRSSATVDPDTFAVWSDDSHVIGELAGPRLHGFDSRNRDDSIVRVKQGQKRFETWMDVLPLHTKQLEFRVRPCHFISLWFPVPTAELCDSLSFAKSGFCFTKSILGPSQVVDVRTSSNPRLNLPSSIAKWKLADNMPTVVSIDSPYPHFECSRHAVSEGQCPFTHGM